MLGGSRRSLPPSRYPEPTTVKRTFSTPLLLAAPLLLGACSSDAPPADGPDTGADTGAPAGTEQGVPATAASEERDDQRDEAAEATEEPEPEPAPKPRRDPRFDFAPGGPIPDELLGDYHVTMSCAVGGEDVGTMTIALWAAEAPITARNFLRLCDEGFYDGVTFHRILRDFMVQGGDPTGTGSGGGPYGTIPAEFSDAPERAHGYGVISMARSPAPDSASYQFFICCDEGQKVWGLDGKYASFGRITSGVATLEALADVETTYRGREMSNPTTEVTITRAEVVEGPAPTGETIARPEPDLGGEPRSVAVQHVLVSFQGAARSTATRSKEEAEALARELLQKALDGEDFEALVRAHSDDPVKEGDTNPGVYRMLNNGVRDRENERVLFQASRKKQELQGQLQRGELTPEEYRARLTALQEETRAATLPRGRMVKSFGDVAFSLEVGEVGLAEHDATTSPFGWHVIKRLE